MPFCSESRCTHFSQLGRDEHSLCMRSHHTRRRRGWPCIAVRALPVSLRGCILTSMHGCSAGTDSCGRAACAAGRLLPDDAEGSWGGGRAQASISVCSSVAGDGERGVDTGWGAWHSCMGDKGECAAEGSRGGVGGVVS